MTVPTYATDAQFRQFVRDNSGTMDQATIDQSLYSASRGVERICGRHFYQTTETQYFSPRPNNLWWVDLDDMELATKSGLSVAVQWSNAANYNEVRTVDVDFVLQPVNQSINGIDGWPFTQMQSLSEDMAATLGRLLPRHHQSHRHVRLGCRTGPGHPSNVDPRLRDLQDWRSTVRRRGVRGLRRRTRP